MDENERFLRDAPVGRLMRRYTVPCIVSLLVGALYNIVDQIYIANAAYLGSNGNAASTVVFPLTVIALAVAVMIGDGCCAFVSISLGRGDASGAKKSVGNSVVMSVAAGLALCALYLVFRTPIVTMFGGTVNEETFRLAREYFLFISIGVPFYVFGQAVNPIIRADGNPRFAMVSILAGALVNIVLDPIFIFVFKWGMAGAAIATAAGQLVTAASGLWYLLRMKLARPSAADLRLDRAVCGRTLALGITSLLSQVSLVAAMAAINNMLRKYGALDPVYGLREYSQIPMAVVGIVMKFFQIVVSVVVGLSAGCIPIVGYNMGAGLKARVRGFFTRLLISEAAVGAAALLAVELFPRSLASVFGASRESAYYMQFAVRAFRIYLCMLIPACINKGTFIFLQAMGRPAASTALSMIREIVFGVGLALLLPVFFGLSGVIYSMPLADLLTFVITLVFIIQTYRSLRDTPPGAREASGRHL